MPPKKPAKTTPTPPSAATLVAQLLGDDADTGHLRAVETGFKALDHALGGGFRTGELVVVGGLPGVGKTVVALQWARSAAVAGERILYACYEHTATDLLVRLVGIELGEAGDEGTGVETLIQQMQQNGGASALGRAAAHPDVAAAIERVTELGDALHLQTANAATTDVPELDRLVELTGATVLIVDYLQKVPVTGALPGSQEAVNATVSQLKTVAMRADCVVLAISSCSNDAIDARRTRLHHLQGSAAVAHEADVVIMVNEKARAVSDVHLQYDAVRAAEHRERVVLSIEKNRRGPANIDLQFAKDLVHFRFDPYGTVVEETLVDELG